ncbi:hypothetical protein RND81_11G112800 [Saponaria officinalis]
MWNNAAFDDADDEDETSNVLKFSWSNINPMSSINVSNQSFDSDCTKENLSPSSAAFGKQPLNLRNDCNNVAVSVVPKSVLKERDCGGEGRNFDIEIEEIEKEISRLSKRLEFLRAEKKKMIDAKVVEKRGRIMASKFMDVAKQGVRISDEERKREELMNVSGKPKTPRRGVSLGPAEIMRGMRRGVSLGPSEIWSGTRLKNSGRQEITPMQPSANRRKSCYWKLQDIDELRVTKERGKSMSVSPKSRGKSVSKPQVPVKAATTIGVRKTVKKEEGLMSSIEPKKLFVKDGEKSVSCKKPLKSGRVVASRYNQIMSGGSSALKELRKRSWPENEEEIRRSEKKRVSLVTKSGVEKSVTESRVKKLWDVPNEVSVQKNVDHKTPLSVTKILEVVPRIKTFRSVVESPRDSGPAKRVSELVGKKSLFSMDDGGENPDDENVCQALDFEEEQVVKEYPKIRVLRCINESPRNSGAAKRVSQLVGRKPFFAADDDDDIPVFSFEEEEEEEK